MMFKRKLNSSFLPVLISVGGALFLNSCGKIVNLAAIANLPVPPINNSSGISPVISNPNLPSPPQPSPIPAGGVVSCSDSQKVSWEFTQPAHCLGPIVDILFVENTSRSMDEKRCQLAKTIPAFLSTLDPQADYQVSVMLGHGGASIYSGSLYAAGDSPLVLSSKVFSTSEIQKRLQYSLEHVNRDVDEARGDALLSSFYRSLDPAHLLLIQMLGFYRENASLAVVFITDKDDICYRPGANEVWEQGRKMAYQKYCLNPLDQSPLITSQTVYERFKNFKKANTLTLGGIIQNGTGHGILELVQKDPHGVIMDRDSLSYATGLSSLVQTASQEFKLLTQFNLSGGFMINPQSIVTSVDGVQVSSSFDPSQEMVSLNIQDAGQCGSTVVVHACKL